MAIAVVTVDNVGVPNGVAPLNSIGAVPVSKGGTGLVSLAEGALYVVAGAVNSGTLQPAQGGTGVTTSTGTGSVVLSTSATLTTPNIIGAALTNTLNTNGTFVNVAITSGSIDGVTIGYNSPVSIEASDVITSSLTLDSVEITSTTGTGSVVLSNSPTLVTPDLGTPSAINLANATGLSLSSGIVGVLPVSSGGTGVTTSTGSGSVVLSTSATLAGAQLTSPAITNGSIESTPVGSTSPSTGKFTTLAANSLNLVGAASPLLLDGAAGAMGQLLVSSGPGATPTWSAAPVGTVTYVDVSGGTTGLSFSGGPVTTSGTLTLSGTLAVASGGTGVTTSTGSGSVVLSNNPVLTGTATFTNIDATGTLALSGVAAPISLGGDSGVAGQVLVSSGVGATPVWVDLPVDVGGTVTSIDVSGGTTGLTFTGGPVTTSGVITLGGTLAVASGGTGVTTSTGSGSVVLSDSPAFTGTVYGITKAMVGLSAVDNTADADKNVLYATTAGSAPASDVYAWAKAATKPTYTKSEVGLANVDNTADTAKPVSTAQQTALNLKADKANPVLTGNVTLSSTTTALVLNASAGTTGQVLTSAGAGATPVWTTPPTPTGGTVTSVQASGGTTGLTFSGGPVTGAGTLTLSGTLAVANGGTGVTTSTGTGSVVLSASPTFTGTVSGITKAMVGLSNVDNTADSAKPVSAAQQSALDLKANLASPTFTGVPAGPTALVGTSSAQFATTAFVNAEIANDAAPIAHVGSGGAAHADAVLGGASGFMTGAEKSKLAGIEVGANAYVHPANHPPSIITQDSSNRFVSDAEKTTWNAKEPSIAIGTTAQYFRGDKSWQTLDKTAVGLSSVDNVSAASLRDRATHTGYQEISTVTGLQTALDSKLPSSLLGTANGVASLGPDGKILESELPSITIIDTFPVSSEAEMLALVAEKGDIAIRSDLNKSYILGVEPPSVLANWIWLRSPTDTVLSVAGKIGVVVLNKGDVGLSNVDDTSDLDKPISTATATALSNKVDKVAGKGLSTEDYTTTEKSKLAGIENGANAYVHPATHPPSIIVQDASNRFVSDAEKASWNSKQPAGSYEPSITVGTTAQYFRGDKSWQTLDKAAVGLANVDNTADSAKPVSIAQQAALDLKANLASPTFTGVVTAGDVKVSSVSMSTNGAYTSTGVTLSSVTPYVLISLNATSYFSGKVTIQAKQGSAVHLTELLVAHNGTNAYAVEYGTVMTSSDLFDVEVNLSAGNLQVVITSASATTTTYKAMYFAMT